jgi:cell division septum initiation protein DivIVA
VDDVQAPVAAVLDRLTRLVQDARALPVSASCVVNRGEVLGLLEELRRALPEAMGKASEVLDDRDGVVAGGRAEAAQLLEQARAERQAMVTKTAVHKAAQQEARRLLEEAQSQADAMRLEVEEYVDSKLANFEVVLSKTLGAVQRGRARLHGESEMDVLSPDEDRKPALPAAGGTKARARS